MAARFAAAVTCSHCGQVRQGVERQPKQLAKRLKWKHGKAKGTWICPECQKFIAAQPK